MFDKWHIVSDIWSVLLAGWAGYAVGGAVWMRRARKDVAAIVAQAEAEMEQIKRKVDFQLKAKGCEGLNLEEGENEQGKVHRSTNA